MRLGLFAGFFIFIMLFQSLDRFGMIAYYEFNKAYITEMFCINKSRPELNCDGKCFLMQKLQEKDQTDEKIPVNTISLKEISLFPIQRIVGLGADFTPIHTHPDCLKTWDARLVVHEVFHPPQSA